MTFTRLACLLVSLSPCLLVFVSGCTSLPEYVHNGFKVGPNYVAPPAPVANDWIDDSTRKRRSFEELARWWEVFDDPILNHLVCTAYEQNLTLRQAGFRILQARAQLGIAVGGLFPQSQFAEGSYTRIGVSGETGGVQSLTRKRFFDQWNFGFGLAWELDFWGRFRRAVESADANLDASVHDYDDVLVTLLSDVATNYILLRTTEQRIKYAEENVRLQAKTYDRARVRVAASDVPKLDEDQAQTLLYQTKATIPELEVTLRDSANRLCILLGIPPEDLQKKLANGERGIPRVDPKVPLAVGIPADLLRRRPDVRRAERQAAAQSAIIGLAESEFYPHIVLSGTLGWSAAQFKNLFRSSAFNGTFGPSFQWNILHYGRLLNNVRLQDARFQELVAAYQNKVLVAQQEVESGLIVYLKAQERVELLRVSADAAKKAVEDVDVRYQAKAENFTRVTQLQQIRVQTQDALAQAEGDIALGLIQVYKALGGGWEIRHHGCEPHPHEIVLPEKTRRAACETASLRQARRLAGAPLAYGATSSR